MNLTSSEMRGRSRVKLDLTGIHLVSGNTSIASTLGSYYIDMRPILPVVEAGYHGQLDEVGVPFVNCGLTKKIYNITIVAQYALALHNKILGDGYTAELERKLLAQLNTVISNAGCEGPWGGLFLRHWDNSKYPQLRAPWVSALDQGNAISALLRGYQLQGDAKFLDTATRVFDALDRPLSEGGVRILDECGHLWFEEYPMDPPMYVLNGFIFALWGILDYARVTDMPKAWDWWKAGVETLRAHIADFDCGYWSVYDLKQRELVSLYYQINIHIPQLEAMYRLTGDAIFNKYAERWSKFSKSLWCRTIWWINLRVQARMTNIRL